MAQIITGAKAIVKIGIDAIAFASGVNVTQENTLADVDVLGQLEVADLAETGHRVSFSVNYFKITDPEKANNAVRVGIENAILSNMRNQAEFEVTIVDDSGAIIYRMTGCKFEGGSGSVDARGLWQGTWNFRARKGIGL
jgi:hypothetical protein